MPSWLLILNDAGFPLFSRSFGLPSSAFTFPTMGLLSAIHSSAGNNAFLLQEMHSHDALIRYKLYTGGLILVYSTSDTHCSSRAVEATMNAIYDSLVFLIGKAKIQDGRHVERTKRQIRSAANLLSLFLVEDAFLIQMSTGIPECCITSNPLIFSHLATLAHACHTLHAAFYCQHRMYAWTPEWASLDARDLFTIGCFLRSATPSQARDVPVYLAHSALGMTSNVVGSAAQLAINLGKTPYRLLTISLLQDLELVLLCGQNPTLMDAVVAVKKLVLTSEPSTSSSKSSSSSTPQLVSHLHQDLLNTCFDLTRHLPDWFQGVTTGMLGVMIVFVPPHDEKKVHQGKAGGKKTQQLIERHNRSRLVTSFLPSAPLPSQTDSSSSSTTAASSSNKSSARRSPSPPPSRGSHTRGRSLSSSPAPNLNEILSPPGSSSSAAAAALQPNHHMFASSQLSEASILTRSHALIGFYHLVRDELEDDDEDVNGEADDPDSTKSNISDAYMLSPNRGFYACRRGAYRVYVMYSEKVSQLHHGPLAWQLLDNFEALKHNLG